MSNFTVIDLAKLPAPQIIENLDYETLLQEYYSTFLGKDPDYDALLESDPAMIILQATAYREMLLRHRINEAAKANLLAYATGADLDQKAAEYDVERLEGEEDERLRYRCQLSLNGYSTAGPIGAYIFYTLSASVLVKSVNVDSLEPGRVIVTILSSEGDGIPSADLLEQVNSALNDEEIRPLTDLVTVQAAEVIPYEIKAEITAYAGPSLAVVENEGRELLEQYVQKRHKVGGCVAISGIYDALHTEGVKKVKITSPATDIIASKIQAAYCTSIELTMTVDYGS